MSDTRVNRIINWRKYAVVFGVVFSMTLASCSSETIVEDGVECRYTPLGADYCFQGTVCPNSPSWQKVGTCDY